MSDQGSQDKQLPASERKLRKAREDGDVVRSRDLGHFLVILAATGVLMGLTPLWVERLKAQVVSGLRFDARTVAAPDMMVERLSRWSVDALWLGFLPGLLLVAGIGWWDDHRPLSPWLRLGVQAVAATMLAVGAGWQSGHWLPALLAFAAAMALVNVWNFMDGINGLAASQAALS